MGFTAKRKASSELSGLYANPIAGPLPSGFIFSMCQLENGLGIGSSQRQRYDYKQAGPVPTSSS